MLLKTLNKLFPPRHYGPERDPRESWNCYLHSPPSLFCFHSSFQHTAPAGPRRSAAPLTAARPGQGSAPWTELTYKADRSHPASLSLPPASAPRPLHFNCLTGLSLATGSAFTGRYTHPGLAALCSKTASSFKASACLLSAARLAHTSRRNTLPG